MSHRCHLGNGTPFESHSHAEFHRNDRGFLRRGENLSPAVSRPIESARGVNSYFVAALFASSRSNVFNSRSDLSRLAATVCLSGSIGGLAYRGFGFRRYLFRFSQFDRRSAFGLGLQCVWLNRFARCDHSGDHLQRASVHGTSLLDSCVLGTCSAGHSLHNVSYPDQILERSSMSLLEGEERPLLRLVITLGGSNLKTRAAFICSTAGRGLAHLASVRDLVSF
jgi:hypothetical protein